MPIFLINFKLYEETLGEAGKKIAEHAKIISARLGVEVIVAPSSPDLRLISGVLPAIAQHIDAVEPGAHTGFVTAESVKAAGAIGTLISHSERKLSFEEIGKCIARARKNGLMSICCAGSPEAAAEIASLGPDYVLIEPPELIGSANSISKTKPDVIARTVDLVKSSNPRVGVICGAGVSTGEDSRIAMGLGAIGVAAASAVAKSKNPEKVIEDIAHGLV
ncbi:MAG: triose-phosphate isomerase [Candidatus Aenigmarchaeota archaeon]|nr:triose-phosphate isomerase [Candidatus Aenigmarchaeota archaeon]